MSESDGQQRMSLLVRNLSYQTSPEVVRSAFAAYGSVKDVYLPLDFHTRTPRGFGFVEFWHRADAERALERMDGFELDGKCIEVAIAKKGRSAPQQMVGLTCPAEDATTAWTGRNGTAGITEIEETEQDGAVAGAAAEAVHLDAPPPTAKTRGGARRVCDDQQQQLLLLPRLRRQMVPLPL
ncbi:hypothetical protein Emag_006352 [Eimeria magna]